MLSLGLAVALGKIFGLCGVLIGLAPALAYALLMLYLTARYGRKECPLLLSRVTGTNQQLHLFQLSVEPEQIIGLQKKAEALLTKNGVDGRTTGRIKLLIEELYFLIREKNGDRPVLSECTVSLRDEGVQIMTKDDGVLFEISEEDVNATSLTAFAVSGYMEKLGQNRHYLTTMSFNRSAFLIRYPAS